MKILTATGIALLTVGLLLSGCAAGNPEAPKAESTPTAEAYEVGAAVEADALLAEGQKAYALPDGTYVVVDKAQPLPDAVQADLNAKTATKMVGHTDGTVNNQENLAAMGQAVGEVAKTTGKRVIAVFKIFGYPTSGGAKVNFYTIMGGPGASTYYTVRADVEAAVNSWLATADNAETYAVVWSD